MQIDYILCRRRSKCTITDARSFEKPRLTIKSDHKILCTKLDLSKCYLIYKKRKSTVVRYNVLRLLTDESAQHKYKSCLIKNLDILNTSKLPNDKLDDLFGSIKKSAEDSIGTVKPGKPQHYSNDEKLVELIEDRCKLRNVLVSCNKSKDRTILRTKINRTEKEIKRRLSDITIARADNLCKTITSTEHTRQMYQAVRELTKTNKNNNTVHVHDSNGHNICSDTIKADRIQQYFK